jgi:hypothetical protein
MLAFTTALEKGIPVDFKTALDRAAKEVGVTHQELAAELSVSVQSIRAARLDQASPNFRNPPPGWGPALASILRRRAGRGWSLAGELEADGKDEDR